MATLDALKHALRRKAIETTQLATRPLSDTEYSDGFDILVRDLGWTTYEDFIIPQLSLLLGPVFKSRGQISVLEIGPGPKTVLGYLPDHLRRKIKRYTALEPNVLFATKLEEWLSAPPNRPLSLLENQPVIHRVPFSLQSDLGSVTSTGTNLGDEKFDIVLFCHSMYGMKPRRGFIERALEMLAERQGPASAMVVVFHRDGTLHPDGLVCHQTASFPTGVVRMPEDDEVLDRFAPVIAGFAMQDADADKTVRAEWRKVCRALGRHEDAHPNRHVLFSSPDVMMAFTRDATTLPELTAQVPLADSSETVKNREARLCHPASIIKPTEIQHVRQCVLWALQHHVSLTILAGGHSGHCLRDNVVGIDMGAFDQVHTVTAENRKLHSNPGSLVVVEAGCKTGDIISKTMAAGLTVPLGSRPSVGAGLWLQGGIGHLARLHGLACDAIIGAIVVSVKSGEVLCIGYVPAQHWPADAVRPENESELLWAMKGAGTNVGIIISVTFKAQMAPTYSIRDWIVSLSDELDARRRLSDFDKNVASKLPRHRSADAYLYWDTDKLHLGVTLYESSTTGFAPEPSSATSTLCAILGREASRRMVDGVDLFDAEMYMSGMHGGHGGGKTSSFKRCLFLKDIGTVDISHILIEAIKTRPSPLCYLHLLQGGGAVGDLAADATAFGCRDWDFACVITGIWPRDQDGTEAAQKAIRWVYNIAAELLPLSNGAYSADLGPDPRDAALVAKAFGPNVPRLASLKHSLDPHNILFHTCPLPKAPTKPKLIILVTGEHCVGKDYCADIWVSEFAKRGLAARSVSISDTTKREYAAAIGADFDRLLRDREYKEQHRPALTAFFQDQVRKRPRLSAEHFLNVARAGVGLDVLLITGMQDEAPVTVFSHLVPDSKLLEVQVRAGGETDWARRGCHGGNHDGNLYKGREGNKDHNNNASNSILNLTASDYRPSFVFGNDTSGDDAAREFARDHLVVFFHEDLQRLENMVRPVPEFPRPGIVFRHVLDICQRPDGLDLCASLLQNHFGGDWTKVDAVVCCEAGGFIFASVLAVRVGVPLVLIREAGKLPPPTISVSKGSSHISSSTPENSTREKSIEMGQDAVSRGASVVVIDDVLATGLTLCAVLQLLGKAGISAEEEVAVMVVAEFPVHRGRELLRRRGFGGVHVGSLMVFDGA